MKRWSKRRAGKNQKTGAADVQLADVVDTPLGPGVTSASQAVSKSDTSTSAVEVCLALRNASKPSHTYCVQPVYVDFSRFLSKSISKACGPVMKIIKSSSTNTEKWTSPAKKNYEWTSTQLRVPSHWTDTPTVHPKVLTTWLCGRTINGLEN